jgi:predicted glutamine amidotransferase
MCELFAMSSRLAATVNLSMTEFARHGGLTGPHADGWGIAFYDGPDVRLIREPGAAADSDWLNFVQTHRMRSTAVISHIRQATQGKPKLSNTHPFARELGGHMHVFAHNGFLTGAGELSLGCFRPVGETDSEMAFCHLLSRLQSLWTESDGHPPYEERISTVAAFATEMRQMGPANFVYSDGDLVFAHGHKRTGRDGVIQPPGLHVLTRRRTGGTGLLQAAGLSISESEEGAILLASVPLSNETWLPLNEGELIVMKRGEIVERISP